MTSTALSLAHPGAPGVTAGWNEEVPHQSVLESLRASLGEVPRLLLLDTKDEPEPPVVRPASPERPEGSSRYQVLGEIGHGGMGAVFKGRDPDLGRDLAIKVLLDEHREKPELIRRFIEEAQIAGQLQHPGVVPVYELGTFADQRPYFTMKLIKGRTLAEILAERDGPAEDRSRLLAVFHQVCQTVAYAHARGVIHRDLKPSNVMVGGFGEVQVMDWGLAKVLPRGGAADDAEAGHDERTVIATVRSDSDAERSRAGSVLGTPAYMAPEQARGEVDLLDERADVFALGSMLCEILTGRPAFTGRGAGEIRRKAERGDVVDALVRLSSCGADADLLALAGACLAPEREDRPRDAGAVVWSLSAHLAGVQDRLRAAELGRAAETARAEEARRTAEAAEQARAAESARAEEAQARVAAEQSRRRRTMALAASLLTMITVGGLAATYIMNERQSRAAARERLLGRAATLLDQARAAPEEPSLWRAALAAVEQVDDPGGITPGASGRLARLKADAQAGLRAAETDAALRQALVDIRANQQDAGAEATDGAYAEAFRAAEPDVDALGVTEAVDRLKRRPTPVVAELTAYLDHWSGVRREARRPPAAWRKPLEVSRAADADEYRDRLRALLSADDRKALVARFRALAVEPKSAHLPAPTAVLLGSALEDAGDRGVAVGLLRRAVARHPNDVWLNFALAGTLA
jgi:serine/threonine-protein kinase